MHKEIYVTKPQKYRKKDNKTSTEAKEKKRTQMEQKNEKKQQYM